MLGWALDVHGVVMRSLWESAPLVRAGHLVRVLPGVAVAGGGCACSVPDAESFVGEDAGVD